MLNNINTKEFVRPPLAWFAKSDQWRLQNRKITILFPIIILLVVTIGTISSCKDNPVDSGQPKNRGPVISSVIIFPEFVGPGDSLIVLCNASDPDGDTLVYDWYTLSGPTVKIKGARPGDWALYNTYQNSQIFFAPESRFVRAPLDTFGLQCAVRDGKGGMDVSTILLFFVEKTLEKGVIDMIKKN